MLGLASRPFGGSGFSTWVARINPLGRKQSARKIAGLPLSPRRHNSAGRWSSRWCSIITGLAVGVSAMYSCSSAVAAPTTRSTTPQYLFSIPSGSGSLTGPNDRRLTLRLSDARRYLTRFTERPLRRAAVVASVDFARRFKGYFASAEPNAVLTYTPRGSQIPVSIVLTIGAPRWNAKREAWTFPAIRIRKTPDNLAGTTVRIRPPLIPNPRRFTHATLLIDGSTPPVVNGCTIQLYAQCVENSNPIELSGGGLGDSLGGFLQQLFMTSIPWTVGQRFSIGLAVGYSSELMPPNGAGGPIVLLPVLLLPPTSFDPTTDARVQPGSLVCSVEAFTSSWQSIVMPSLGGAYIFNLSLYGSGQTPIYTATLRYTRPPSGIASPGCA